MSGRLLTGWLFALALTRPAVAAETSLQDALLWESIHNGDPKVVRALLDAGVDPDKAQVREEGYQPDRKDVIAGIVSFGLIPLAMRLVEGPYRRTELTPLQVAAFQYKGEPRRLEVVAALVEAGAKINRATDSHDPPLAILLAATRDAPPLDGITWFLDHGARPDGEALSALAIPGRPLDPGPVSANAVALERLLDAGGDLDRDVPLCHAIDVNDRYLSERLLARGASPAVRCPQQVELEASDPLTLAIRQDDLALVERLAALGAPVDGVRRDAGRSPLRAAVRLGNHDAVRRLLALGADPLAMNDGGYGPLRVAAERGDAEGAALLLSSVPPGADRDAAALFAYARTVSTLRNGQQAADVALAAWLPAERPDDAALQEMTRALGPDGWMALHAELSAAEQAALTDTWGFAGLMSARPDPAALCGLPVIPSYPPVDAPPAAAAGRLRAALGPPRARLRDPTDRARLWTFGAEDEPRAVVVAIDARDRWRIEAVQIEQPAWLEARGCEDDALALFGRSRAELTVLLGVPDHDEAGVVSWEITTAPRRYVQVRLNDQGRAAGVALSDGWRWR